MSYCAFPRCSKKWLVTCIVAPTVIILWTAELNWWLVLVPNRFRTTTSNWKNVSDTDEWAKKLPRNGTSLIDHEYCRGKERLLAILYRTGKTDITMDTCRELPLWSEVVDLYGKEPVILGLETCQRYRDKVALKGGEPDPRVAGLFNTGTNALANSLKTNFQDRDILDYNAPAGGKHKNLRLKKNWVERVNRGQTLEFPIVLVRDPFFWMKSMCRAKYKSDWVKGEDGHCPNLVPNSNEQLLPQYQNMSTFPVTVIHHPPIQYDSLADMWSDWYQAYVDATFPRLIIRFEDTLFHAEEVMKTILECIGRPMETDFKYYLDKSKHFSSTDFVTALAKYGTAIGRDSGLSKEDRVYVQTALDSELMQKFHYRQILADDSHGPSATTPGSKLVPHEQEVHETFADIVPPDMGSLIDDLLLRYPECLGKKKLLEIVYTVGGAELLDNSSICLDLPTWDEVASLYGDKPIIHGLDSCQRYREHIHAANTLGKAARPDPRVGGLYDTGTNAFADLLMLNFEAKKSIMDYNIPGGKHTQLLQRTWERQARIHYNSTFVFPVVLVRDPYRWMNSMCKASYAANWLRGSRGHCPNLVPSPKERQFGRLYQVLETYEVNVTRAYEEHYKSLADMWSVWYKQWIDTTIPSLVIRFEDIIFHTEEVMQTIMDCIGHSIDKPLKYQVEATKRDVHPTDFFAALVKYGRAAGREGGMRYDDKLYARTALDPNLLQLFHYKHIPLR